MNVNKNQCQSVISKTMTVRGDLRFKGGMTCSGTVDGTLEGDAVFIEDSGVITGVVQADTLECHGRIDGEIKTKSLFVGAGSRISGKIFTERIAVRPEATLNCLINCDNGDIPSAPVGNVPEKPLSVARPEVASATNGAGEESFFYGGAGRGRILCDLKGDIDGAVRIMWVCAEQGSGKTTLCRELATGLSGSCKVVTLSDPIGSIQEILVRIAEAAGLEMTAENEKTDLFGEIRKKIFRHGRDSSMLTLLLDDAEKMYPATLEGVLRNLTALGPEGEGQVKIVLFGDSRMKPQMEAYELHFKEESGKQYELSPLTQEETRDFIEQKLKKENPQSSQGTSVTISGSGANTIHSNSKGIIGRIDTLAAQALARALEADSAVIQPRHVRERNGLRGLFG